MITKNKTTKNMREILTWLENCPTAWDWSSSNGRTLHIKVAIDKPETATDIANDIVDEAASQMKINGNAI
tara:strand:- start:4828 stop:5037 length:210 start_codon:yes stop_codon:yes gene_type:complete